MAGWREEYIANLQALEAKDPINMDLVQACSELADRVATLQAEKTILELSAAPTSVTPPIASGKSPSTDESSVVAQLRLELSESLRSKNQMQTRLRTAEDEAARLRSKTTADAKVLKGLGTEKAILTTRLEDREHELREKKKLVEDVQDEMITLHLQLAMAEKERDQIKIDNQELVERWMKRMAQEAEAMNISNQPTH